MTIRTLVPVAVLEGQTVDRGVIEALSGQYVAVLGYHVIPEQTSPEQARTSFEAKAQERLEDVVEAFDEAGAEVTSRLVFTHDRDQTFRRVADEEAVDALVRLNPTMEIERVLVTLHGVVDAERIGAVTAALAADSDVEVHLLQIGGGDAEPDQVATVRSVLADAGVVGDRVSEERLVTDRPVAEIVETAAGFDAVVLGEKAPTLSELVLGDYEERIAGGTLGPVFVVRAPDSEPESPVEGTPASDDGE